MNKKLLCCLIIALSSHYSFGQVTAYEGFTEYTDPLNQQGGGTSFSWSQDWANAAASGGAQDGANSTATLATGNLTAPTDYVFFGGSTSGSDLDGQHVSDVGGGAIRTLAPAGQIDLSSNDTKYFSVLWNESGAGGGGNIQFRFLDNASFGYRIFEFTTASQAMSLSTGNAATTHGSEAFTAGQDYLLVAKIESQSGVGANDTISFSLFQNGSTIGSEPVTWDVSGLVEAGDTDGLITRFYVTGSGNIDAFDEVRFGDTFEDVTGVPEPSTAGLILLAFCCLLGWRRAQAAA